HTRFDCDWSSDVCSSDLDVSDADLADVSAAGGDDRGPRGRRGPAFRGDLAGPGVRAVRGAHAGAGLDRYAAPDHPEPDRLPELEIGRASCRERGSVVERV